MTEQEAIKWQDTFKRTYQHTPKEADEACDMAIKSLEEIQRYRATEKRLSDMFGGQLTIEDVVQELERLLVDPDKPHPVNAKILTYEDADAWEAYKAIGTPEECRAAVEKRKAVE